MRKMQREHQVSFVFSSHDPVVLAEADDAIFISDGRITGVERRSPASHTGGSAAVASGQGEKA